MPKNSLKKINNNKKKTLKGGTAVMQPNPSLFNGSSGINTRSMYGTNPEGSVEGLGSLTESEIGNLVTKLANLETSISDALELVPGLNKMVAISEDDMKIENMDTFINELDERFHLKLKLQPELKETLKKQKPSFTDIDKFVLPSEFHQEGGMYPHQETPQQREFRHFCENFFKQGNFFNLQLTDRDEIHRISFTDERFKEILGELFEPFFTGDKKLKDLITVIRGPLNPRLQDLLKTNPGNKNLIEQIRMLSTLYNGGFKDIKKINPIKSFLKSETFTTLVKKFIIECMVLQPTDELTRNPNYYDNQYIFQEVVSKKIRNELKRIIISRFYELKEIEHTFYEACMKGLGDEYSELQNALMEHGTDIMGSYYSIFLLSLEKTKNQGEKLITMIKSNGDKNLLELAGICISLLFFMFMTLYLSYTTTISMGRIYEYIGIVPILSAFIPVKFIFEKIQATGDNVYKIFMRIVLTVCCFSLLPTNFINYLAGNTADAYSNTIIYPFFIAILYGLKSLKEHYIGPNNNNTNTYNNSRSILNSSVQGKIVGVLDSVNQVVLSVYDIGFKLVHTSLLPILSVVTQADQFYVSLKMVEFFTSNAGLAIIIILMLVASFSSGVKAISGYNFPQQIKLFNIAIKMYAINTFRIN